jgi:superfamily I DNA/RNA helicase
MAGLEVRGRSHVLRRSYRTTRAILAMALAFYRQRLPGEDPDVLSPDLDGMRRGRTPILLNLEAPQDERLRVVREITQAVERGLPLRHILILHASGEGAQALMEALNKQLGEGSARDPKYELPGDFIRVTTLNAGTGLESPVVFVTGLHTLLEREDSLRLSEEDRVELVEQNTRKLYMAFTRAGQRLVLTCAGDITPSFAALAKYGLLETEA